MDVRISCEPVELSCNFTCDKTFPSHSELLSHRNSHYQDTEHCSCDTCQEPFLSKQQLTLHVQLIHNLKLSFSPRYQCHLCNNIYLHDSNLEAHKVDVHGQEPSVKVEIPEVVLGETFTSTSEEPQTSTDLDVEIQSAKSSQQKGGDLTVSQIEEFGKFAESLELEESNKRKKPPNLVKNRKSVVVAENKLQKDKPELPDLVQTKRKYVKRSEESLHKDKPDDVRPRRKYVKRTAEEKRRLASRTKKKKTKPIYQCDLCEDTFASRDLVSTHISASHTADTIFPCDVCDEKFRSEARLVIHKYCHEPSSKCKICGITLVRTVPNRLKNHIDDIHLEIKPYQCGICQKKFSRPFQRDYHVNDVHLELKPYVCNVCGMQFNRARSLRVHLETHEEKVHDHICEICGKGSSSKRALQTHIRVVHLKKSRRKCDLCGHEFPEMKILKRHMLNVHQIAENKSICDICGCEFASSGDLKMHMMVKHGAEKPYKCDMCDYSSITLGRFRSHKLKHTGEKPFACIQCNKKFVDSQQLQGHVKLAHSDERPFGCSICSARFKMKGHLKYHLNTHDKKDKKKFEGESTPEKYSAPPQPPLPLQPPVQPLGYDTLFVPYDPHQHYQLHNL